MKNYKTSFLFLAFAASLVGCKTYNTVLHNGPDKTVPDVWDVDEPIKMGFFGGAAPVSLKKACGGKAWETAKIYEQWPVGWKYAVKCKGKK